jgi:hypothetical protein
MKGKPNYTVAEIIQAFKATHGDSYRVPLKRFIKKLSETEKEYKLRAECRDDIKHFEGYAGNKISDIIIRHCDQHIPDHTIVFKSKLSIDALHKIIRKVSDGHIMLQTLNLKEKYTGKRNMDIE